MSGSGYSPFVFGNPILGCQQFQPLLTLSNFRNVNPEGSASSIGVLDGFTRRKRPWYFNKPFIYDLRGFLLLCSESVFRKPSFDVSSLR